MVKEVAAIKGFTTELATAEKDAVVAIAAAAANKKAKTRYQR